MIRIQWLKRPGLFTFCLVILLYSCGKDTPASTNTINPPAPSPPIVPIVTSGDILKKHSWYPKQYQAVGNDTINVYKNGLFISQTVVAFDSTHIFEDCIQQSKYDFINNDTFLLFDNCKTFVPLINHWSLQTNGQKEVFNFGMLEYGITNYQNTQYFIGVNFLFATLDFIDNTKFVFSANQNTVGEAFGLGPNNESMDSVHRSGYIMTTTFVSR